ncbi:MAG: HNH endonuclease [Lachnospiraceae bacterium]|nr:HNH endonuclease [Lachnospiraceae bacterium]
MKYTKADYFRRTQAWTDKAIEIKQRDNYLCQICIRRLYNTLQQYNYDRLSVHHAIPINTDWERKLDNDNLITICQMHHEMAERGDIPYEVIKNIIDQQEAKEAD